MVSSSPVGTFEELTSQLVTELPVRSLAESLSFYRGAGFKLVRATATFGVLSWGDRYLFLTERADVAVGDNPANLRVIVGDVDAHFAEAIAMNFVNSVWELAPGNGIPCSAGMYDIKSGTSQFPGTTLRATINGNSLTLHVEGSATCLGTRIPFSSDFLVTRSGSSLTAGLSTGTNVTEFVDFVSFNVYLESKERLAAYLARLQNIAGFMVGRKAEAQGIAKDGGTEAIIEMGGKTVAPDTTFMASEDPVRGFWNGYRRLMGL